MRPSATHTPAVPEHEKTAAICDHPDCSLAAEFRAPKGRDRLDEYYWFCLEHVREYNRSWNFCADMDDRQIEREIRNDTVWRRPTWPFGGTPDRDGTYSAYTQFRDDLGLFEEIIDNRDDAKRRTAARSRKTADVAAAMSVMRLDPPLTLTALKSRYKELVKRFHPDTNGGDRNAEDRLKSINEAYAVLRKFVGG